MSDFVKNDNGKLQWSLMPFEQLEDTVRVLMKGAEKYSRDNWKKGDDVNRYKDALMRHVTAYIKGEERDPEDNLPHLAHAICNCLFLQYFDSKVVITNTKGWIPVEEVKENEEAYLQTIEDANGNLCRCGDHVLFYVNCEKHFGIIDWNKDEGFSIKYSRGEYLLVKVDSFEKLFELKEDKNEQKAVRCPSKEDD